MILIACWILPSGANDACMASAHSDLERLYCEITSRGEGSSLPSRADFKRNDPQVQALLLRRPAARLGLAVPAPGGESKPSPAKVTDMPPPSSTDELPEAPANDSRDARPASPVSTAPQRSLAKCRLEGESILCPGRRLELAVNQNNSELLPGVLEAGNTLSLSSFEGERNDDEAVRRYLSDAYDIYIPKMLAIGLGGTTMSFTAFHHAFHSMENGGVDFARRLEQTYHLLKQDKKTLAVKARYHDELPKSLNLCTEINRDIVVCDNVGKNWVYVTR
ncbi:MAG: hypothetical protein WD623_01275 [Marinobacter sp.]|uniref:hypothetical protein n=1 Tax=Marinobacter sp. TaxID=50741 RepID=UPI0034A01DB8